MSEKDRTPEEWEDAFQDVIDDPDSNPIRFYSEEETDVAEAPKYGSLWEAIEAWKKEREERKQDDRRENLRADYHTRGL
jgi:hypothetical protein